MIPIVVPAYPDELLYSYIRRLAILNCVSFDSFCRRYLGYNVVVYDVHKGLGDFFNELSTGNDMTENLLDYTVLGFASFFMNEADLTRYLYNAFYRESLVNMSVQGNFTDIYVCPECFKEDIERHGEGYLHRINQLGVRICTRHRTPLMYMKRKTGGGALLDLQGVSDIYEAGLCEVPAVREADTLYSGFAEKLLKSHLFTDVRKVYSAAEKRLFLMGFGKNLNAFSSQFKSSVYGVFTDTDTGRFFTSVFRYGKHINVRDAVAVLMFLYNGNADELLADLRAVSVYSDSDIDGFDVVNKNGSVVQYRCRKCGNEFCMTRWGMSIGLGCPACSLGADSDSVFKRIVDNISYGEYSPLEAFKGYTGKMRFHHIKCGQDVYINPKRFLFEGTRCICRKMIPYAQVKFDVESGNEFRLIEYTDTQTNMKVCHNACGSTFAVKPDTFRKSRRCSYCATGKADRERKYRHRIGRAADKFDIRCGINNRVIVTDKNTHNTYQLTPGALFREISSPYGSKLLNLSAGAKAEMTGSFVIPGQRDYDRLYMLLKARFSNMQLFFLKDIAFDGWSHDQIRGGLYNLRKAGVVKLVDSETYAFVGVQVDSEDVIKAKYLEYDGIILGYRSGACFMNDIGADVDDKAVYITSVNWKSETYRKAVVCGREIWIRRSRLERLDERNVKILPVVERLSMRIKPDDNEIQCLRRYLEDNGITIDDLMDYADSFPVIAEKRLRKYFGL